MTSVIWRINYDQNMPKINRGLSASIFSSYKLQLALAASAVASFASLRPCFCRKVFVLGHVATVASNIFLLSLVH